jgi:hypothetical protein
LLGSALILPLKPIAHKYSADRLIPLAPVRQDFVRPGKLSPPYYRTRVYFPFVQYPNIWTFSKSPYGTLRVPGFTFGAFTLVTAHLREKIAKIAFAKSIITSFQSGFKFSTQVRQPGSSAFLMIIF